jgi:hypothetical protein
MAYTTSDNDAETLTAIRKANKAMKESGVTWAGLADRMRQGDGEPVTMRPRARGRDPFTVTPEDIFGDGGLVDRTLRIFEQAGRARRSRR